ncbi:MAG: GDP-mannose 4,6-dehydratase, partial [Candidatus Aureabacteria bacterium]|nr:GDP-mannose 4,6-dehydratase [Candidatus Auribacterota bacterium]
YFNVFGDRQDPKSEYAAVIPRFIAAALGGGRPMIYGDGRQTRDFTYVANVVTANLCALSAPTAALGQEFNVACGEETDLLTLLAVLGELAGRAVVPVFAPARPGDVRRSRAEIGRARDILGYRPEVGLRDGLKKTMEWFNQCI